MLCRAIPRNSRRWSGQRRPRTSGENLEESGKLAQLLDGRFPTVNGMDATAAANLKQDLQEGRITTDRLCEVLASQQRTIHTLTQRVEAAQQRAEAAEQRCAELEQKQ